MKKVKRKLRIAGLVFLSCIVVGFLYESTAEFIDRKAVKVPGQLIQVGNHKMHIYCTGENKSGSPTVILEAGGSNNWATWSNIQPEISKYTRVCSYDRSGYGFSEGSTDNRTNVEVVQELETLLINADVQPPYILAGHSIGGYYIRVFADRNPAKVKGLVFIASSHEDQAISINQNKITLADKLSSKIQKALMYSAVRVGILRLSIGIHSEYFGLPKENVRVNRALLLSQAFTQTNTTNDFNGAMQSIDQVAKVDDLGSMPIRVLTEKSEQDGYKFERQQDLASLSTNAKLIPVANANHYIHVTQPQVVIDQIFELINIQ